MYPYDADNMMEGGKRRKSGSRRRSPNAYIKFANAKRASILREHPDWASNVVKVAKETGKLWRAQKQGRSASRKSASRK